MRLLYVVFIFSIAALLWAAYAISRSVQSHRHGVQGELSLGSEPRDDARL